MPLAVRDEPFDQRDATGRNFLSGGGAVERHFEQDLEQLKNKLLTDERAGGIGRLSEHHGGGPEGPPARHLRDQRRPVQQWREKPNRMAD